jgi:replicative DNA helicase
LNIKFENRSQEISYITRNLKVLAKELEIPVIVLSQLSRTVETRINKRPMLSDLRESGSIEQDADIVIMLYREDYYTDNKNEEQVTEFIVAKHRNGPIGTARLLFKPMTTTFHNL